MRQTIDFAFALGDRVIIIALDRPAKVDSQTNDCRGLMYRVIYWSDGARRIEWVYEDELKAL